MSQQQGRRTTQSGSENTNNNGGRNDEKQPRTRGQKIAIVVMIVLAVIAAALGGAWAFVNYQLGKMNNLEQVEAIDPTEEDFEVDTEDGVTETAIPEDTMDAADVDWGEDATPLAAEGVTKILLIGQDTRVAGERARSDSMMLLTVNGDNNTISLISFMRDLYVQIPGYSDNRINAAYRFGGAELLDQVLSTNFGLEVDHNIEVDFEGFTQIIDLLGGVNITLNSGEVALLQSQGFSVTTGDNLADGATALAYSRIRYVPTDTEANDYGRTQRQRNVLTSIYAAFWDSSITDKLAIADQILPLISTDMSSTDIVALLYQVQGMNLSEIGTYRIPGDGTYSGQTIRGMSVLVPDLSANRALLQEYLGLAAA